jgi:hypothetical protein
VHKKKKIGCNAYGYLVQCGMCGGMNTVRSTLDAWSRSSVVCVATSYGLDGQGFESRYEQENVLFCKKSGPAVGPTQPPVR